MGDGYECFRSLPGGKTLQVYHAVLCDYVMGVRSCICNDRTVGQCRTDSGNQFSLLVLECGRAADKTFSSLGKIGTKYEIQLSTGTADVFNSGTFSIDLSIEVNIHGIINGNEIIKGGN